MKRPSKQLALVVVAVIGAGILASCTSSPTSPTEHVRGNNTTRHAFTVDDTTGIVCHSGWQVVSGHFECEDS